MKRQSYVAIRFWTLLVFMVSLILIIAILPSAANDIDRDIIAEMDLVSPEGNATYQPLIIICERQGKCLYAENLKVKGKSLLEYGNSYANYEWYIKSEGNNQYSIHYFGSPSGTDYILTYDENGNICLENVSTTLQPKHKWVFDYTENEVVIGATESTRIQNVGNELYLFGRDNEGLMFTSDDASFADARQWKIIYSLREEQNELTNFSVRYSNWVGVNSTAAITIITTPSPAYRASFPNDFVVEIGDSTVASYANGVITGLKAGTTFIDVRHKYSELSFRLPLTVGQVFANGEYYICNRGSSNFFENTSTSTGDILGENTLIMNQKQRWIVEYAYDGYYTIKSSADNKYISLITPAAVSGIGTTLSSGVTDSSLWKIIGTTQGGYAIISKFGESYNYSLYANLEPSYSNPVKQYVYVDDCSYYDEWYFQLNSESEMFTQTIGLTLNQKYYLLNVASGKVVHIGSHSDSSLGNAAHLEDDYCCSRNEVLLSYNSIVDGYLRWNFANEDFPGKYLSYQQGMFVNSADSYCSFHIKRINFYPYEGTYLIVYNDNYLCLSDSTSMLGISMLITDSCVWSLTSVDNFTVNFFDFSEFSDTAYPEVSDMFSEVNINVNQYTDQTAAVGYDTLQTSSLYIFRGHASPGVLSFNNSRLKSYGTNSGTTYSLDTYSINSLRKVQMAFFQGCESGVRYDSHRSLQEVAFEKGVHFALATYDTVYTHHGNFFIEEFIRGYSDGKSVQQSLFEAQEKVKERFSLTIELPSYDIVQDVYPIIYIGDIYQRNFFRRNAE